MSRDAPLKTPSIKRLLYRAYRDLNSIEANIYGHYWPEELSNLERAVLVLEDRRYFKHYAVDVRSVIRELLKKITFRRHGGASTIEMQFVRTCTGYRERTLKRKTYEMFLAWALLYRASKMEILRSYLQIAFFGSGIIGADRASLLLFQKTADDLTVEEACVIASMLVYPRPVSPTEKWNGKIKRRSDYGQRLFAKIGYLVGG
ncbi:MAG: transglycosylase domain-containing protein [Hyphomicrobiales bacterium]|nr:transglycosylase domain-containing protein [Hyphomicrobiales bacterium]